jgi:Tol biopolymer transport system component
VNGAEPAWTPDGRWILFVNDEFSNLVIERVRPNGKGRKLVTSGEEGRRDAVSDPDQQPL